MARPFINPDDYYHGSLCEFRKENNLTCKTCEFYETLECPKKGGNGKQKHKKYDWIIFDGKRKSIEEWSDITGIPVVNIICRLSKGWSTRKTLKTKFKRRTR